jgi:hypothetical protein
MMAANVTDAELKAYTAGYDAATKHLEALLGKWSESKEPHASCACDYCRKLRAIARKKFEDIRTGDV